MKFVSTRGHAKHVSISEAFRQGLAGDGGLFVPESWPAPPIDPAGAALQFASFAAGALAPFFAGDALAPRLADFCGRAFDFPLPLVKLNDDTEVLELFHGPTSAFKDFGARFLALCLDAIPDPRAAARLVLVATSGDTGGAVAAAFHDMTDIPVAILFPKGKISARQEKQLTSWGPRVRAFAVEGTFDDCQRLVKLAFATKAWTERFQLISANSINIGRLLPQMCYFAHASLRYRAEHGRNPGLIVPSGNAGNAVAALWARKLGYPIREVVFAHNANHAVPDYFRTGNWEPQPTIATLANAMDVGNPSNFERALHLHPTPGDFRAHASAMSVSDDEIKREISASKNYLACPHTATGLRARSLLSKSDWIIAATAHPAKFDSIVEPLVGRTIPVPPRLREILGKPSTCAEIPADLENLGQALGV